MGTKRVFGASQQHAVRSDRDADGSCDLGVRVARVAQQQTLALPFWHRGQRSAYGVSLLASFDALGLALDRVAASEPFEKLQSLPGTLCAPQPIEGVVQGNASEPGGDLGVGARLENGL